MIHNDNMKIVGSGGYSIVYEKNEKEVIKKIRKNPHISFLNSVVELNMIIDTFSHPYIVECKNFQIVNDNKDDIIFVFEKANYDLHTAIHEKENVFNYKDLKIWMMQILVALDYLHSNKNIIHRDIKPENILIFLNDFHYKKVAKLTDFGISTNYSKRCSFYTNVCTSLYRAPELCLEDEKYDHKIDIWSLGAVFFEMVTKRRYLDIKDIGNDDEIIKYIFMYHYELNEEMEKIGNKLNFEKSLLEENKISIEDRLNKFINKNTFEKETKSNLNDFINLLKNMLCFNKTQRFSSYECLKHPFFNSFKIHIQKMIKIKFEEEKDKRLFIKYDENRDMMSEMVFKLFLNRNKLEWYKNNGNYEHRILFSTIDIFDRYNMIISREEIDNKISTKKIKNIILVIIYICMKYFLFLKKEYSFINLALFFDIDIESKDLVSFQKIETDIIKKLIKDDKIYRETVYDIYETDMSENDLNLILLLFLKNKNVSGLTPKEFIEIYTEKKNELTIENIIDCDF